MNDRVRRTTAWVLLAVFAVAVLVGVTAMLNSARATAASAPDAAVNDATTGESTAGSSGSPSDNTLSPVELGILADLGYSVTTGSG